MAIRQVKQKDEPSLPPAHLFLEDVEEIVSVLLDREKQEQQKRGYPDGEPKTDFVVKDRECDSIDDLKKIGGRWRHFKANAGLYSFVVKPHGSYVIYDNVFDPIYRIVSARKAGVMATLIDLPWWVVVVVGVLVANIAERMSPKNSTQIGLLVVLAVSSIGFLPLFRHTVVELRYSYERTPKWRNVKEWLAKGLWIIIGVILAGLGQIIWSYMKKHLGQ